MNDLPQTVFLVDDYTDVRDSLKEMLQSVNLCVETFASASEFLASYDPERPGCLVLDVHLPDTSGLALQDELIAREIDLPIIFLAYNSSLAVAVSAMKKGAYDFMEKPMRGQVLIDRVQAALIEDGRRWPRRRRLAAFRRKLERLTAREREVLDLLWAGKTTQAIAEAVGICPKTVRLYRARILEKVDAQSLPELVALLHGLGPGMIQRLLSVPSTERSRARDVSDCDAIASGVLSR